MTVRLAVLFCCVAAATAAAAPAAGQPQHVALQPAQFAVTAPAAKLVYATEQESPAQYEYQYSVKDPHSGDDKQMKENRSGDDVKGFYAFVQPDGVRRIVEYSSSKEHGFNAVVRYEGQPVPAPAKVVYAGQAPVAYAAAPTATVAYAPHQAPVAYAQAPASRVVYAAAPQAAQNSYAHSQPAPFALTTAQAAPVAYTQGQIAYALASYAAAPPPVGYAPAPAPVAYAVQPAVAVAPAQRLVYTSAPKVSYTQANVAYAARPQVAYTQASDQVVYSAAPVAYAQAPINKIAYYAQPAPVNYAAAPIAKLAYAQPSGHIAYAQ